MTEETSDPNTVGSPIEPNDERGRSCENHR